MRRVEIDDPFVTENNQEWLDFIESIYPDLPAAATTMALSQVFMFLLQEYQPPLEEITEALGIVVSLYASMNQAQRTLN